MIATFTVPTAGIVADRYTVESTPEGITIEHELVDGNGGALRSVATICIEPDAIGAAAQRQFNVL